MSDVNNCEKLLSINDIRMIVIIFSISTMKKDLIFFDGTEILAPQVVHVRTLLAHDHRQHSLILYLHLILLRPY